MEANWQKYLTSNVPRYTSYPSALSFGEQVGVDEYAKALENIGQYEPISLYLHIPFCKQLCWYCGCNMRVENRDERISQYVDVLIDEIESVGARLSGRGNVSQVHFGGGTPNTLTIADIERLLSAIEFQFGLTDSTPVVMEIDPRLCGVFQASQLVRLGINRFSIGVQDFDPDVQEAINRPQSFELVKNCMSELRDAGVKDISLDVLYGLPHQKLCTIRKTIEQVIDLRPDRVSLFGYAHMPGRFKHQQLINEDALPSRDLRVTLSESAAKQLIKAGYERIGFDHFALPDSAIARVTRAKQLNRNFQGFTEDPSQNVLGFGVSAISSVHNLLAQNAKFLPDYTGAVSANGLATERGLIADLEEEDLGDWIRGLLCDMEASLSRYFEIVNASQNVQDGLMKDLGPLIEDGIVEITGEFLKIKQEAKALARSVAAVFDPQVTTEKNYASPAV